MVLVASGALLVITQVHIGRLAGRLGPVATISIAVSAVGALLSIVAWAGPPRPTRLQPLRHGHDRLTPANRQHKPQRQGDV